MNIRNDFLIWNFGKTAASNGVRKQIDVVTPNSKGEAEWNIFSAFKGVH